MWTIYSDLQSFHSRRKNIIWMRYKLHSIRFEWVEKKIIIKLCKDSLWLKYWCFLLIFQRFFLFLHFKIHPHQSTNISFEIDHCVCDCLGEYERKDKRNREYRGEMGRQVKRETQREKNEIEESQLLNYWMFALDITLDFVIFKQST